MKKTSLIFFVSIVLLSSCSKPFILEHKGVQKVADGFIFTEGPAADKAGNVYFTDIPNHKIHVFTTVETLELYRDSTGGANGLFFDKQENLVVCEGMNRQITSIDRSGAKTILSASYQGKRYNKPNDLWVDPKGGIYFSDPAYGVDSSLHELDGEHVYYILPSRDSVIRVCNDLVRPNGIVGSPDGKKLYITDHYGKMTWVYQILPDGTLTDKRAFVPMGCDGLTMDAMQNIYLTNLDSTAIDVFSADGEKLLSIPLPERPTNICFGGSNHSTLYITAPSALYTAAMNIKGSR